MLLPSLNAGKPNKKKKKNVEWETRSLARSLVRWKTEGCFGLAT